MAVRDLTPTGSVEEMERRFWTRYAPGQQLYLATAQPREHAHIVIDNTDPSHPHLIHHHEP
jgi:uridine kinase